MKLLALLALAACSGAQASRSLARTAALPLPQPSVAPSVLIVLFDDLGWPEWSLLPSLAGLTAQGTTFTRAYSYPTCSASRIGLLFGHLARRDGIGDLSLNAHSSTQDRLKLGLFSMPELFTATHATALVGKWHLGRAPTLGEMDQVTSGPFCQGFESWRAGSPSVLNAGAGSSGYYGWWRAQAGDMAISSVYATDAQRDELLAWWTTTSGPKLAVLSWSAPHAPYDAPPGMGVGATARAAYEQTIAYLDLQLALVLDQVDLQTTLVVVTSDNGTPDDARPPGAASGIWKGSTFEGGVRVPLLVAGPAVGAGTSARLVSQTDLGATLAEIASIPVTGGFEDSFSFADELGPWAGTPARTFVFAERYDVAQSGPTIPQPIGYDDQAVIEVGWKLRRVDVDGPGPGLAQDVWYTLSSPGVEQELTPSTLVQERLLSELASLPPRAL